MALVGGDVGQYEVLRKSTVDTYCLKLKAYVDIVAGPEEKKVESMVKGGRNKVK